MYVCMYVLTCCPGGVSVVEALFLRYLIIPLAPATTWASPSYIHKYIHYYDKDRLIYTTYKPLPHTPRLTVRFPTAAAVAYSDLTTFSNN